MEKEEKTGVAVFVKYPDPGKAKTRLAKGIGVLPAADIYRRLLHLVMERVVLGLPRELYEPVLFCDPFRPREDYASLLSHLPLPIAMQSGDDLGARLAHSFEMLLTRCAQAVAIGTDCIELSTADLDETREKLRAGVDVVLGPALDGGYYLIGMRRPVPALFDSIHWSTQTVLAETLERARSAELSTHLLPYHRDIDSLEDLEQCGEPGLWLKIWRLYGG